MFSKPAGTQMEGIGQSNFIAAQRELPSHDKGFFFVSERLLPLLLSVILVVAAIALEVISTLVAAL